LATADALHTVPPVAAGMPQGLPSFYTFDALSWDARPSLASPCKVGRVPWVTVPACGRDLLVPVPVTAPVGGPWATVLVGDCALGWLPL
jgi:hypothetical protein